MVVCVLSLINDIELNTIVLYLWGIPSIAFLDGGTIMVEQASVTLGNSEIALVLVSSAIIFFFTGKKIWFHFFPQSIQEDLVVFSKPAEDVSSNAE